jgi:hypothetical protein
VIRATGQMKRSSVSLSIFSTRNSLVSFLLTSFFTLVASKLPQGVAVNSSSRSVRLCCTMSDQFLVVDFCSVIQRVRRACWPLAIKEKKQYQKQTSVAIGRYNSCPPWGIHSDLSMLAVGFFHPLISFVHSWQKATGVGFLFGPPAS